MFTTTLLIPTNLINFESTYVYNLKRHELCYQENDSNMTFRNPQNLHGQRVGAVMVGFDSCHYDRRVKRKVQFPPATPAP